jgi:hypothetical protein
MCTSLLIAYRRHKYTHAFSGCSEQKHFITLAGKIPNTGVFSAPAAILLFIIPSIKKKANKKSKNTHFKPGKHESHRVILLSRGVDCTG